MSDTNVLVKIAARSDTSVQAAFKGIQQGAKDSSIAVKDTTDRMNRMGSQGGNVLHSTEGSTRRFATEIRGLDRGVMSVSHGFQGLMASAMMAGATMQNTGGQADKAHLQMMKAVSTVAQLHAGFLVLRGTAMVFTTLSGSVSKYAGSLLGASAASAVYTSSTRAAVAATRELAAAQELSVGAQRINMLLAAGAKGDPTKGIGGSAAVGAGSLATKFPVGMAAALGIGAALTTKSDDIAKYTGFHPANYLASWAPSVVNANMKTKQIEDARMRVIENDQRRGEQIALRRQMEEKREGYGRSAGGLRDLAQSQRLFRDTRPFNEPMESLQEHAEQLRDITADKMRYLGNKGQQFAGAMSQQGIQTEFAAGPKENVEAARAVFLARQDALRLAKEQEQVEKKIDAWDRQINRSTAEGISLGEQLTAAGERRIEAEKKVLAAVQAQKDSQKEGLVEFRNFAREQEKYYSNLAKQEKDRLQSQKSQFGLLEEGTQRSVLRIAEKMKAGGKLNHFEIEFAKGHDLLRRGVEEEGVRRADKTGIFQKVVEATGADRVQKEAEKQEKFFADIKVQTENKIALNVNLSAEDVVRQLTQNILPVIDRLQRSIPEQIDLRLRQHEQNRQAAARGAIGVP